jgi:cephalosporin hydroxylase
MQQTDNLRPLDIFKQEVIDNAKIYAESKSLHDALQYFYKELRETKTKYGYNFFWLGVPIIQVPQDLQAMQEIIWETKPDLIIETGIAWGGSIIFSASMLAILETCDVIKNGHVLGIDVDIRSHNKQSILAHPMSKKITMLEGSSLDETIIAKVKELTKSKRVMVCLDSNHTHEHVLAELQAYAPLVSKGCYCVVGDTLVDELPQNASFDRPWGKGNNPKTALFEYLKRLQEKEHFAADGEVLNFEIDKIIDNKLIITGSPDGYLKRV